MNSTFTFGTFWADRRLSEYERACLTSFVKRGYEVALYSFSTVENAPPGVVLCDASEIVSPDYLNSYYFDGSPNLSHFSDLFRYELFRKTDRIWIDCDVLMVNPMTLPYNGSLFARLHDGSICGAIMRVDRTQHDLSTLLAQTKSLAGKDLRWGETGPLLLTQTFGRSEVYRDSHGPELFYPIPYSDFWKPFLPEYADDCARRCDGSITVHLWNNIVDRLGIWKDIGPPVGSFLNTRFREDGTSDYFRNTYPAGVVRQMIANWLSRQSGADLGIGKLSRQLLPSVVRSARSRGWLRRPPVTPALTPPE